MHKYFQLFSISWQNGLVYRTSVLLWRLRQFLSTVMALTIWTVIFDSSDQYLQYSQPEMITYIFIISILQSLILSTSLHGLGMRVYGGQLSQELVRPVNLTAYFATQEAADKLINVFFVIIETIILFILIKPEIIFPSFPLLILTILWSLGGVSIFFFIQLVFGSFGFWSPDTWGPRFLFFMFLEFTAGKIFPLNILPLFIQRIVSFTPFPYLSFAQVQLFINAYSPNEIILHSFKIVFWIIFLFLLSQFLWKKGLRNYTAAGQ